ncbi:MAG: hypothetical protein M3R16_03635 [Pseudomonadota bacterium]|nr:hypothetical protein [Pseudomonadota bacterium]
MKNAMTVLRKGDMYVEGEADREFLTEYRDAVNAVDALVAAGRWLRNCADGEGADVGSVADMRLDAAKDRFDTALADFYGDAT